MFQIEVRNLSKKYRYGRGHQARFDTVGAAISSTIKKAVGINVEEPAQNNIEVQSEHVLLADSQFQGLDEGWFWALKDINFNVQAGQRIGIYGKNGSGKSTLLKLMSQITMPTDGYIKYKGKLVSLLEVGTGFHPDLSGRENIVLNAQINGMSLKQINKKFDQILEFSELGKQIDMPIKRYSSGMYMRLAFSVAAHLDSEILIVDEVLAVGDTGFQKRCMEKMLELGNSGRTLIFVSHDPQSVKKLCNSCLFIKNGEIVTSENDESLSTFGHISLNEGETLYKGD